MKPILDLKRWLKAADTLLIHDEETLDENAITLPSTVSQPLLQAAPFRAEGGPWPPRAVSPLRNDPPRPGDSSFRNGGLSDRTGCRLNR